MFPAEASLSHRGSRVHVDHREVHRTSDRHAIRIGFLDLGLGYVHERVVVRLLKIVLDVLVSRVQNLLGGIMQMG